MFQTTNQLFNHTLPFLCVYCWHMLSSVVFICFLQPSPLPTRIFLAHGCYTGLPTLVKCCTFSTDETSCFNTARKKKKTHHAFLQHPASFHIHPHPFITSLPIGRTSVSSTTIHHSTTIRLPTFFGHRSVAEKSRAAPELLGARWPVANGSQEAADPIPKACQLSW